METFQELEKKIGGLAAKIVIDQPKGEEKEEMLTWLYKDAPDQPRTEIYRIVVHSEKIPNDLSEREMGELEDKLHLQMDRVVEIIKKESPDHKTITSMLSDEYWSGLLSNGAKFVANVYWGAAEDGGLLMIVEKDGLDPFRRLAS